MRASREAAFLERFPLDARFRGVEDERVVAALAAVSQTDMATTQSHTFASRFADTFGLILKEPPVPNTGLDLTIVWSHVRAADPVLAWLRKVIGEVAKATMDIGSVRVSRAAEKS